MEHGSQICSNPSHDWKNLWNQDCPSLRCRSPANLEPGRAPYFKPILNHHWSIGYFMAITHQLPAGKPWETQTAPGRRPVLAPWSTVWTVSCGIPRRSPADSANTGRVTAQWKHQKWDRKKCWSQQITKNHMPGVGDCSSQHQKSQTSHLYWPCTTPEKWSKPWWTKKLTSHSYYNIIVIIYVYIYIYLCVCAMCVQM